jgi:hypothetical protein
VQNELWHRQTCVACAAKGNELCLAMRLGKVNVPGTLASYGAFPGGWATVGHVVVAREKAGVIRQGQDALDRAPERMCIASRKIATRRAEIGHEKRIMYEGGIADHVGNGRRGVTGREQHARLEIADVEDIAVGEQPVPL